MDLKAARATELRVLEPICDFLQQDGYLVYRAPAFPRFYGGNGIELQMRTELSLADCEALFARHFAASEYEHKTFTFDDAPEYRRLLAEAAAARYHVVKNVYLGASHPAANVPLPSQLMVRKVDSEERWALLRALYHAISIGNDWYDEAVTNELFEKTRASSRAIGIDWYYLGPADRDELWCKFGIFSHGGVCCLQDVGTRPDQRRQGLASALVNHAIGLAFERGQGLIVCAEEDYHALDLYRKLGFQELGASMQLMWYEAKG
jgi:ribosomal protein S18 acetylase RimI-like enzyme